MSLIENNDVIQTVSAYWSDNTFTKRILPWRARSRDNLLDIQTSDPTLKLLSINRIPITQQKRGVESKGNASTSPADASVQRYPDAGCAVIYASHRHSVKRFSRTVWWPLMVEDSSPIDGAWPPDASALNSQRPIDAVTWTKNE